MFGDLESNPYLSFVQDDFYRENGQVHVYLGEDSVTRRMWEYEQNDFMRYFARVNPLGSEEKFLEARGELFGETLYEAYDDFLEGEEVLIHKENCGKSAGDNPGAAARQTLYSLGRGSNADFYSSALEAVEDEVTSESLASASEI